MKNNKIIVIIGAVLIGIFLWTFVFKGQDGEELVQTEQGADEISELLGNLKSETGINFSKISKTSVHWIVEATPEFKETDLAGKGFEAKKISDNQNKSVEEFLIQSGFEIDMTNISDGTVVGLIGYKKGQIVCTVTSGASGYKEATGQWIPQWDEMDIEVKCGKLN